LSRFSLCASILVLVLATTASAQIKLQPSQLLRPQPVTSFQIEDQSGEGKGFSEVIRDEEFTEKNPWQAFLMSFVLPGAGEHYTGSALKSRVFFGAEVSFWSAFVAFRHLGSWREDDYKNYAIEQAGANLDDKEDRFYDILGFYDSREDYNKTGGVTNPGQEYLPNTDNYNWSWSSLAARERYRDLKNDSKSYYRNSDFALGLIIANHFLSAVDAYWSAKRHNRRHESGFSGINLRMREEGGVEVQLSARF
jgi:hypothetical protein